MGYQNAEFMQIRWNELKNFFRKRKKKVQNKKTLKIRIVFCV